MAYVCPRCGGPVARDVSAGASILFGLVGALVSAAFGSLKCAQCGEIGHSEFPPEVRSRMTRNSILMGVSGVVLFVVAVSFLAQGS